MIPAFVKRVDMPDRGGAWIEYLHDAAPARRRRRPRGSVSTTARERGAASVRLLRRPRLRGGAAGGVPSRRPACRRRNPCRGRGAPPDELLAILDRGRRAAQPPPQAGSWVRGAALQVRDRVRLRRLPRPPAPPHADLPVAAARLRARRRRAGGGRGRRLRRPLPRGPRHQPHRARATARRGFVEEASYAVSLAVPHPLRPRSQCPRGAAPHRAALRPRGPRAYRAIALEMLDQIAAVHRPSPPRPRSSTARRSRGSSACRASCAASAGWKPSGT